MKSHRVNTAVTSDDLIQQTYNLIRQVTEYLNEKYYQAQGPINRIRYDGTFFSQMDRDKFDKTYSKNLKHMSDDLLKLYANPPWWSELGTEENEAFQKGRVKVSKAMYKEFKAVLCTDLCILACNFLKKQKPTIPFIRLGIGDAHDRNLVYHELIVFNPHNESLDNLLQKKFENCQAMIVYDPWNDYMQCQAADLETYLQILKTDQPNMFRNTLKTKKFKLEIFQSYEPTSQIDPSQSNSNTRPSSN